MREINPTGTFDTSGRWYATNKDLINVRTPSRAYPYSELCACRTRKYVIATYNKFNCKTEQELIQAV